MGKTHLVHPEKEKVILTDTTPEGNVNAADIEYVMDQHVLVIPTFFHNTVAAYTIEK